MTEILFHLNGRCAEAATPAEAVDATGLRHAADLLRAVRPARRLRYRIDRPPDPLAPIHWHEVDGVRFASNRTAAYLQARTDRATLILAGADAPREVPLPAFTGSLAVVEVAIVRWIRDVAGVDVAGAMANAAAPVLAERCRRLALLRGHVELARRRDDADDAALRALDARIGEILRGESRRWV